MGWPCCLAQRLLWPALRVPARLAPRSSGGDFTPFAAAALSVLGSRRQHHRQQGRALARAAPLLLLRPALPHFLLLSAAGAGFAPFTPASVQSSRVCHHLSGEEAQEMPAAPRPDLQSDGEDEFEPESPMEPESALESHSTKRKVGRKAKKGRPPGLPRGG